MHHFVFFETKIWLSHSLFTSKKPMTINQFRPLHAFRPLVIAAFIAGLSACGGGGDSSDSSSGGGGGSGGGTQQPSTGTLASYAGQYDVQTQDGTALRITVDATGKVTSCGAAYSCQGTLALKPGGQGASLQITGNDGQTTVGLSVSIDASVTGAGAVSGTWTSRSSEGTSSGTLTGQKTPGSTGGTGGGTGGGSAATLASFAGKYNLRANEGTALQFTAAADGSIRTCVGEVVYACNGSMALESGGQGARFTVSGNDGESPPDTTVTLTGKVDLQGNATGSYNGTSKTEGSFSGTFAGTREGGSSTTSPGTAQGCTALAGSWTHSVGGTWAFSGSKAVLTLNSINYGPRAQQITELALSSCASGSLQYKIVRAALINTVDPSFAYDKKPGAAGVDWNKSYNQPYTLSGRSVTIGNYSYAKQ